MDITAYNNDIMDRMLSYNEMEQMFNKCVEHDNEDDALEIFMLMKSCEAEIKKLFELSTKQLFTKYKHRDVKIINEPISITRKYQLEI